MIALRCAATVLATALIAGCGSDRDSAGFTAESFVVAANEHDAGLTLGEPLPYGRADGEVRAVRFEGAGPAAAGAGQPTDAHGSGTLAVFGDDEAAISEYERCDAAGLACFRAGNVTLSFFGTVNPADLERLGAALSSLADG